MEHIVNAITAAYNLLWGDLFVIPLPGGGALGVGGFGVGGPCAVGSFLFFSVGAGSR